MRTALARALSLDEVNQLGRDTGQSERRRTVTPHRLFLSAVTALAGRNVETLADLLRGFNPWVHAAWIDGKRVSMAFLLANARRSNPVRDRKTGRLRTGLRVVGGHR